MDGGEIGAIIGGIIVSVCAHYIVVWLDRIFNGHDDDDTAPASD